MKRKNIRDQFSSALGSVGEWYDFSLYGFLVPILSLVFFPDSSQSLSVLKSLSVLALGFCARPIGALIFGHISDKYGRSKTLKITPFLITFPTFLIGFLPSFESIGLLSPFLLLVLRFLQGIAIGGEHTNNMVYLCESAKKNKLFFNGSIASLSGSFGIFLASIFCAGLYYCCSKTFLVSYGWRIAFLSSSLIGFFIMIFRRNLSETKIFLKNKNNISPTFSPIFDSFKNQKRDYIKVLGVIALPSASFYFVFLFLPTHFQTNLGVDATTILGENAFSLMFRLAVIPLLGLLADKIGGIRLALLSSFLFLMLTIPLLMIAHFKPSYTGFCLFSLSLMTTLNASTTPGLLVSILPERTRSTILSFSFNLGFGIIGGLTPVVCQYISLTINTVFSGIYVSIFALATLITLIFIKKEEKNEILQTYYR